MRNDLTHIEEVEKYLLGTMTATEAAAFETRMQADEELAQDVALQQQLMDRINFNGFRADMLAMHGILVEKQQKSRLNRYFLSILIGFGLATLVWIAFKTMYAEKTLTSATGTNLPGQQQTPVTAQEPDTTVQIPQTVAVPGGYILENAVETTEKKLLASEPEISFDRFLPEFHKEVIDNERDFTFRMADSKSYVHVPADCMEHASGADVAGPVEIRYREYRDAAQIAFSQIPMTYLENGILYNFNSAGMFEIRAYQNGEELKLKPEKPIVVDYNATQQLDNCYFFQLKDEQWKKLRDIDFGQRKLIEDDVVWDKRKDSTGVLLAMIGNTNTGFQVLTAQIEMQIAGKTIANRSEMVSGGYVVKNLPQGDYSAKISCPGFVSQEIDLVRVAWDSLSEIKVWLEPIPKKKTWIQKWISSLKKPNKQDHPKRGYTVDAKLKAIPEIYKPGQPQSFKRGNTKQLPTTGRAIPLLESGDPGHTYPNLVKGLNCPEFGVYNCDQIYVLPDRINVEASYRDENGKSIDQQHVLSMVDLNYNGAFSFSPTAFSCSASGRNVLLLFTKSGKLFALQEADFKSMNITSSGKRTFTMKDITNQVKNTEDLRTFLGLKP